MLEHPSGAHEKSTSSSTSKGGSGEGASERHPLIQMLRTKPYAIQTKILEPGQVVQREGAPGAVSESDHIHQAAAHGIQGGGGSLPHLAAIQQSFGSHDVSSIQAHTGSAATQANEAMGAEAYATGNHVAFKGTPDLHTAAHEAAHVVQQRSGVSVPSGVGSVGDSYEQHADAVADAVVAGQSAEGLLNSMGGGGSDVQQKAVQKAQSKNTIGASEQARVKARGGAGLEDRGQYDYSNNRTGTAKVNTDPSKSMAENPNFEADAIAFEKNLGVASYSKGQKGADALAKKARDYLRDKVGGGKWSTKTPALLEELKKTGSNNAAWSGSVGLGFQDLLDAFEKGNVAVKMNHVSKFYTAVLLPDIQAGVAKLDTLLAGMDQYQKLSAKREIAKSRTSGVGRAWQRPQGSEVGGQGNTRASRQPYADPNAAKKPAKTGEDQQYGYGPPVKLDPAEKKLQTKDTAFTPADEQIWLQWVSGAETWALNEFNQWTYLRRELSLPLGAGPSGTTDTIMKLTALLGTDPYETRMACMGYLLPSNHHSLVEVMEAAVPYGCSDLILGRMMYTRITGFSEAELRSFGKENRFPHEVHGDMALEGNQVVAR